MTITARLFDAHLHCRTKCYLLSRDETGTVPEYARWQTARQEAYRKSALPTLTNLVTHGQIGKGILGISSLPDVDGEVATGVVARTSSMESCLQAVETVPVKGGSGKQKIRPVLFCRSNKLGRTEKLMAVFDAVVLSDMLGRRFSGAKIIYGEAHSETVVSSPAMAEEVRKRTATIATLIAAPSPPDLILIRHCSECEFQTQCRQRAVEKDDLSLLSSLRFAARQRARFNLASNASFQLLRVSAWPRSRCA